MDGFIVNLFAHGVTPTEIKRMEFREAEYWTELRQEIIAAQNKANQGK